MYQYRISSVLLGFVKEINKCIYTKIELNWEGMIYKKVALYLNMNISDAFLTVSFKLLLSFSQHIFNCCKIRFLNIVFFELFTNKCMKSRSSSLKSFCLAQFVIFSMSMLDHYRWFLSGSSEALSIKADHFVL